jgi:hypothetical protein
MRKFFTLLWLLFPVAVLYYHFTEGQNQLLREKARIHITKIRTLEHAKEPDWETIVAEYDKVASELPAGEKPLVLHQIRLAKAKARLEMLDIAGAITKLTRAVREMLGKAHYYATYLLKTNGAAEEEWRPYAERTRQIFRYLAEHQDPAALARYEQRVGAEFEKTMQRRTP